MSLSVQAIGLPTGDVRDWQDSAWHDLIIHYITGKLIFMLMAKFATN